MKNVFASLAATCFLLLGAVLNVSAQSKAEEKYRKESDEISKDIWNWSRPEFKVREIPAKYNTLSKVVLAHHTELSAGSKSKLVFTGLGFGSKKEISILEIVRKMIRVNDKAAVDDYSEFTFTKLAKGSSYNKRDQAVTYVGVRIIKPDGKTREVDADDVVLTKDLSNDKQAKLAIPDLQPGDIIDYFIATDQSLTNDFSVKEYSVVLFDEAPVLHQSFHGQLGRKFAIDYRSYNGAPGLAVSKNEDDDIVIDVSKKNTEPFETSLWVSPLVQLPFIRMNISLGARGASRFGISKPGEVNKNKPTDEIIELLESQVAREFYEQGNSPEQLEVMKYIRTRSKKMDISFRDLSDEERASMLFYALRFTKLLNFDIDQMERSIRIGEFTYNSKFSTYMLALLKKADVEGGLLVSSQRTGFRINEVMETEDLVYTPFLAENKKFIGLQSVYDFPFVVPQSLEGMTKNKSIRFKSKGIVMEANLRKAVETTDGFNVPLSQPSANAHLEELKIAIDPSKTTIAVNRKTRISGNYKLATQRQLVLYEDFYDSERKAFGEEMGLVEKLEDSKKSRKYVDEVKNALAEARKKQKEAFVDDAKEWYEQEVTDLKDHKVISMGVRHTSPDLIYSSSFNMDGLIKKAGNNLIFEIGKIQGTPLIIKPEQRKRDIDVFMSFPRSLDYVLEIKIPEGYTVEGVAAINKNVENETGYFIADAKQTGDVINLTVKRRYKHSYEPVANWDKLVAFLDAGNEWSGAKLLFKKK